MSIRSFWLIVLKIIGIFLIMKFIYSLAISYSMIYSSFTYFSNNLIDGEIIPGIFFMFASILVAVLYLFAIYLLIFRTEWIIDKLKLEKGFDEENLLLNLQWNNIIKIGLIVLGGLLLIDAIPRLIREFYYLYQQRVIFNRDPDSGAIIFNVAKIIVAYILIAKHKIIVDKFIKPDVEPEAEKSN